MNYDDLHKTSDYPYMRAYNIVTFEHGEGSDSWLQFEINRARKMEAPQDTVFCAINGEPHSVMEKQFDAIRDQMEVVAEKYGWIKFADNPPDSCIGDPRTVRNPDGWD